MNKAFRMVSLILGLGLVLSLALGQRQGQAAGQAVGGLKRLASSAVASGRFALAPRPAPAAPMATITVTSLADGAANAANCPGANCRLRDAIAAAAAAGDTITFSVNGVITLINNSLIIAKNLTIQGPGAAQLTISGNNQYRVFEINSGFTVALSNLTIANGGDGFPGGGINNAGNLTLTNCTLSGNYASSNGIGGGGINNTGTLTITGSTLAGNSAGNGGGINNEGTLTLINSTLSSNSAAGNGGGIYTENGSATISNSTLSGNTAGALGGGVNTYFGGMTIINSTISGNSAATAGGGIYNYGNQGSILHLTNCTITNNSSSKQAGGVYINGFTHVRNTIIAGNYATVVGPDVQYGSGRFNSLGYNLIGVRSDFQRFIPTTGDQFGGPTSPINPLLGPLANYGGPTQTHALLPGSPALNAGTNCVLTNNCASDNLGFNLTTDQRGAGFNRQVGSAVDIGAFESRGFTLALAPANNGNNQSTALNTNFANPLAVTVSALVAGEPVSGGRVTFTPPGSGASATIAGNPATFDGSGAASSGAVTANGVAGSYTVQAGGPGLNSVSFNLTNVDTCPTIVVTNPAMTTGTAGTAFSQSFTQTGGAGTVTFSLASGSLPTGLTLASDGTLSGSPTQTGSFPITVRATDSNTCTGTGASYNLTINCNANLVVTSNADSGAGSLREAIALACTGNTISFAGGINLITLASGQLTISKNLTIQGPGAAQLTISGNNASRVFRINGGFTVALSGMTIANGKVTGACCGDNSTGGGILNSGALTITNSTISGNSASFFGGGIFNSGALTITGSTVSGNSTTGGNGNGAGIYLFSSQSTIINSTISGNTSDGGGGGISSNGALNLINSTISGNSAATAGGGILIHVAATVNSRNTLIAGNTSFNPDISGGFTSLGYNLIGNNTGATITPTTGDQIGTAAAPINPLLAPLANYGGPTQTHALLAGSPALNAGNNCVTANNCASHNLGFNLTTDQRGASFNRQVGNAVDIGAFEFINTAPTFTPAAAITRQKGSLAGAAVTVGTVADGQTAAGSLTVTQIAGGTATGITVSGITNANGTITALVSASCTATAGTVRFQVSDGALTGTGNLQVNVTGNPAPMVGAYANTTLLPGGNTTVTPATAPSDDGTITSVTAAAPGFSGTLTANTSTGAVTITGANPINSFQITVTVTDNCGQTTQRGFTLTVSEYGAGLMFYPLPAPVRLLDTRGNAISPNACTVNGSQPIAGNTSLLQPARGICGIPANAQAITGNVTTVQSGGGYLTLYPSDAQRPTVASTNYVPNEIVNNVFTVGLGNADGAFDIYTLNTTEVVVDVTGYYAPPAPGGLYFHPLPAPVRLLETRAGQPVGCVKPGAPLAGGADALYTATTACTGIPAAARALVGNATTISPEGPGYLTLYPAEAARPLIASSNYDTHQIVNGPFTTGLSGAGEFKVFTLATTDLVIDVLGYYSAEATDANGVGLLFTPLARPVRWLETRAGQPVGCFKPSAPLNGNQTYVQTGRGVCDGQTIPASALAVVGNATVVYPVTTGYLTLWPSNALQPTTATSNYGAGQIVNRHFIVGVGNADGAFKMFSYATTDLVIDLSGYFAP